MANVKFSAFPAASATADADYLVGLQGGINVKATALQLKTYVSVSPTLTGTPLAPTASLGTNTTQIATTAGVLAEISNVALPAATGSVDGYLLATDWTTFNNKLSNLFTTGGDLIVGATTTGAPVRLGAGTSAFVLTSNGSGTAPSWQAAASSGWALTGTSTLTGVTTIVSNAASQHIFNGTWTATANNQNHIEFTGSLTTRNTASDIMRYMVIDPTMAVNGGAPATQTMTALLINPTFTGTATKYVFRNQNAGTDIYTIDNFGNTVNTQGAQTGTNTFITQTQAAHNTGSPVGFSYVAGAHTALTFAEFNDWNINLSATAQITVNAGAIGTLRSILIQPRTYSFTGAGGNTITDAATVAIAGAPIQGSNAAITRKYALWIPSGNLRVDGTISGRGDMTLGSENSNTIFNSNNALRLTISTGGLWTFQGPPSTGGTWMYFAHQGASSGQARGMFWQGQSNSGQTASTDINDWTLDFSALVTFNTGSKSIQRGISITPRTYQYSGASTIDDVVLMQLNGAPISGVNNAIHTNTHALRIASASVVSGTGVTTNSYGLTVLAQSGATNNYTMRLATSANADLFTQNDKGNIIVTQAAQSVNHSLLTLTQAAHTGGSPTGFVFAGGALTGITASELIDFNIGSNRTVQFTGGTGFATQRASVFLATTYAFASATGTITDAATVAINAAPIAGTNAVITNSWALLLQAGNSKTFGKWVYDATITAGGTTGNQTINKPAGTVNIAAAGTTVTVTNSLCTTSSIVQAWLRTNDATARIANIVPGSGSFVINLTAAATAEVSIGFIVNN